MRVILNFGILLLVLSALLAVFGAYLVGQRRVQVKGGMRYSRVAATLVAAVGYWMTQNAKVFAGLSDLNLVALLGLLWVVSYFLVWGLVVYQINKMDHENGAQNSAMLSMLFTDSQHMEMQHNLEATAQDSAKPAGSKKSWSD
jgi:hypothetical protein